MTLQQAISIAVCVGALGTAYAAPTPAPVRSEIDRLLARLETSGCQFYRNGTWYDATAAKAHLLRKLELIERRRTLESTEQFIALAGTSSSVSGKTYEVRCDDVAPMHSAEWLESELVQIRSEAVDAQSND